MKHWKIWSWNTWKNTIWKTTKKKELTGYHDETRDVTDEATRLDKSPKNIQENISLLREMVDRHAKELTQLNKRLGRLAKWFRYIETFSIGFFMGNCKSQTAKCHVTTALRSRLQFAVHVWTAGRASSGKWFTTRFFTTKNCTASRLKAWTSFLYPFAMCLLDFLSRINELLLVFGRLNWCTSTW